MKKTTWSHRFLLASLLLALQLSAQPNSDQRILDSENTQIPIPFNCGTVFWTTNAAGQIRQWNLIDGVVTGGTQILTAGNINGIGYGGDGSSTVFFCAIDGGMRTYDQNGWNNTFFADSFLSNNGSYVDDHYFMSYSTGSIIYYDETSATIIPLAANEIHAVADIAVDSSGNAWVFTQIEGDIFLKKYNGDGLIDSYPITMDPTGVYGAFFLNDQLYVATVNTPTLTNPNSIFPIYLTSDAAVLGTPIPFLCNSYTDLASCNVTTLGVNNFQDRTLKVYPNPTTGIVNISSERAIDRVAVYTVDGKLIQTENNNLTVDLTDLPSGSYLLKVESAGKNESKVIIKN